MKKNMGVKISIVLNLILCAALVFTIFSSSMFGSIKTTYKIQYEERTSLFESVPTLHADVVFLGDSLTQNGLWNELFPDISIVNRGIRGDTTSGILKRVDNVIQLQPRKIFLMAGVNDLHMRVNKNEILNNYREIINTIQTKLPGTEIYIQSILPVHENKHRIKNDDIDKLNLEIKKLADGRNIVYVDINSKLKADNNELDPKFTADGEHLKGNAYNIWVGEIKKYIE